MTGDDGTRGEKPRDDAGPPPDGGAGEEAAKERRAGLVPDPEPEEAPELLGERSDYPIVWDGEDR